MHRQHELIHRRDNRDGFVELTDLVLTLRRNKGLAKYLRSIPEQPSPRIREKFLMHMYYDMMQAHKGKSRKQKNPVTGQPYNFFEHDTCVASIVAILGYPYQAVTAGIGHDWKDLDQNLDFIKVLEGQLKDTRYDPEAIGIIIAKSDFKSARWGGPTFNKNEERENALMDWIVLSIGYPYAIPVGGADTLHNLLSFDEYDLATQKRKLHEIKKYRQPIYKSVDTKVAGCIEEIIGDYNLEYHVDEPLKLLTAVYMLKRRAELRRGTYNGDIIYKNFTKLEKEYTELAFSRIHSISEIIRMSIMEINGNTPLHAPNMPKFEDLPDDEKEFYKQRMIQSIESGNARRLNGDPSLKFLDGLGARMPDPKDADDEQKLARLYNKIFWTETARELLIELMEARNHKRIIENYFEHSGKHFPEMDELPEFKPFDSRGYVTKVGEAVINLRTVFKGTHYHDIAKYMSEQLGLKDPMAVYDKTYTVADGLLDKDTEGIRIIYDGGLTAAATIKNRTGSRLLDSIRKPEIDLMKDPEDFYIVLDIIGGSR